MHILRRHLRRLTWTVCALLLVSLWLPTVARAWTLQDMPATWADICSVSVLPGGAGDVDTAPDSTVHGGSSTHCPWCSTPFLALPGEPTDRSADFSPAPGQLKPPADALDRPRPAPFWRLEATRAPPRAA